LRMMEQFNLGNVKEREKENLTQQVKIIDSEVVVFLGNFFVPMFQQLSAS